MGYHSWDIGILTCDHESGRGTLSGGQFDWGGRLQKSNGGAQRFVQHGWNVIKRRRGFIMTELVFILDRSGSMAGLEAVNLQLDQSSLTGV